MKEKIINYIETLEAKSLQVDDYFKQRNDLYIENQNKDKEIERLNNIINELEKFIDEEYRYYNKRNYPTFGACMRALNRIKDKLQELKGSDKE